jgi:hypothetical protein
MKYKNLWKGLFSYRSEMEVQYAYAYSKAQAKVMMLRRLANKHDVSYQAVFGMFDGSKPNYQIIIETEFKEVTE